MAVLCSDAPLMIQTTLIPFSSQGKRHYRQALFIEFSMNNYEVVSIGNSIISSAITDKQARVSF